MSVAVVIVAAGRGRRLGSEVPKQYIPLAGACALRRSIEAFLALPAIEHVVTVIHPDDRAMYDDALRGVADPRVLHAVEGGATRAASVAKGLTALERVMPERVLIHDAARPFVSARVIEDLLAALETSAGAVSALPVVDALWLARDGTADQTVPRDGLWRAQTPQAFHFRAIREAHRTHDGSGADDVAVAREAGMDVALVLGEEGNYKITTAADLDRALSDLSLSDHGPGSGSAS